MGDRTTYRRKGYTMTWLGAFKLLKLAASGRSIARNSWESRLFNGAFEGNWTGKDWLRASPKEKLWIGGLVTKAVTQQGGTNLTPEGWVATIQWIADTDGMQDHKVLHMIQLALLSCVSLSPIGIAPRLLCVHYVQVLASSAWIPFRINARRMPLVQHSG